MGGSGGLSGGDVRAQARAGVEALRGGDPGRARSLFQAIVAGGHGDGQVWLGLAYAARDLKDEAGKLEAIEQALAHEPKSVRALMLKADHFAEAGDRRTASGWYGAAIKAAAAAPSLGPELAAEVRRAQARLQEYSGAFEDHLREALRGQGLLQGEDDRFARSLDILVGRRQVFLQQPRFYYLPELPQRQFYERSEFSWASAVEASTDAIRAELLEVLKQDGAFTPYVEKQDFRQEPDPYGLLGNPDWSAFYLWKHGELVEANAARCPRTVESLSAAPLCAIPDRTPSVLFSLLRPGARIPPHTGYINARLICHLPLIVPDGCGFRVGNETRAWREGELTAFDDTMEHEAWNEGDRLRVVLLFEIWRPELSEQERRQVSAMVQAVDAYGGGAGEWD